MSKLSVNQLAINNFSYRRYSIDYFFDACVKMGVKNIELSGCHPHFTIFEAPEYDVKGLAKKLSDRGLKVAAINPEQNFLPINIASRDDYLREQSIKQLSFFIDAAPELGCDRVIVYPGKAFINYPHSLAWKYARKSLEELAALAAKKKVTLLLEPVSPFISDLMTDAATAKRMMDQVGADNIGVCANSSAIYAAKQTLADYFELFGDKIGMVQLSDSCADNEQMVWGEGDQDIKPHVATLEKVGYAGPITIELLDEELADHPDTAYATSLDYVKKYIG